MEEKLDNVFLELISSTSASGLTKIIDVNTKQNIPLGQIRWFAAWRRYCFMPNENTVFDTKCLSIIINIIDNLMEERNAK